MEALGMPAVGLASVDVQASSVENVIITASPPFSIQGHISRGSTIFSPAAAPSNLCRSNGTSADRSAQCNGIGYKFIGEARQLHTSDTGRNGLSSHSRNAAKHVVQSIRFGGQDVLHDGLHIDGATSETLEIVVSPSAGRLEGNVSLDRQKFANATVVLIPPSSLRPQTSLYQTTQTNSEGHFTFETFHREATKCLHGKMSSPWGMVRCGIHAGTSESRGTEVLIRESAKESIEMTLIPR